MANFYCAYCGRNFPSVQSLTLNMCPRHPEGASKGSHILYEGSEKAKYTCKFCGQTFPSISTMTGSVCKRHPNGVNKGRHFPAL